jgi:hypothetical protein
MSSLSLCFDGRQTVLDAEFSYTIQNKIRQPAGVSQEMFNGAEKQIFSYE